MSDGDGTLWGLCVVALHDMRGTRALAESGEGNGKAVSWGTGRLAVCQGHHDPWRSIGSDEYACVIGDGRSLRTVLGSLGRLACSFPFWGCSVLRGGLGAAVVQAASPSLASSQAASRENMTCSVTPAANIA